MENEKRLIDANATKTIIQKEMNKSDFQQFKDVLQCVCNILDHSDTVDAVEVVHGRWLNWKGEPISPDDYWRLHRCSVCGNEWEFPEAVDTDEVGFNYCPNCGAKMDL